MLVRLGSSVEEAGNRGTGGSDASGEAPAGAGHPAEGRDPVGTSGEEVIGVWSGPAIQRAPRGTRQSVSVRVSVDSLTRSSSAGSLVETIEDGDGTMTRCGGTLRRHPSSRAGGSIFAYTEEDDRESCAKQTRVTLRPAPNGSLGFRETYSTSLGTGTVTGTLERVP